MALTKRQLALRKIGGSDVATILGLNPYKSAVELYHEKRGTIEVIDLDANENVEAGNVLEDAIADLAARHMSRQWNRPVKLRRCNQTLVHAIHDWLTVHIDRDVVGEDRGVECKNVGARAAKGWGEALTDQIPEYYLPQPHTYMLVKNYPVWTVAAYFGGADLRLYEIERDREWDEIIIARTQEFWRCVETGTAPSIDVDAPRALEIVKRIYPGTSGEIVVASEDDEHWRAVVQDAEAKVKFYQAVADSGRAHLLAQMGDAALMRFRESVLERKLVRRKAYEVAATEYVSARFKRETTGG